jgi:hypothetical protein
MDGRTSLIHHRRRRRPTRIPAASSSSSAASSSVIEGLLAQGGKQQGGGVCPLLPTLLPGFLEAIVDVFSRYDSIAPRGMMVDDALLAIEIKENSFTSFESFVGSAVAHRNDSDLTTQLIAALRQNNDRFFTTSGDPPTSQVAVHRSEIADAALRDLEGRGVTGGDLVVGLLAVMVTQFTEFTGLEICGEALIALFAIQVLQSHLPIIRVDRGAANLTTYNFPDFVDYILLENQDFNNLIRTVGVWGQVDPNPAQRVRDLSVKFFDTLSTPLRGLTETPLQMASRGLSYLAALIVVVYNNYPRAVRINTENIENFGIEDVVDVRIFFNGRFVTLSTPQTRYVMGARDVDTGSPTIEIRF